MLMPVALFCRILGARITHIGKDGYKSSSLPFLTYEITCSNFPSPNYQGSLFGELAKYEVSLKNKLASG